MSTHIRVLATVQAATLALLSYPTGSALSQMQADVSVSLTDTIPDSAFAGMVLTGAKLFNNASCTFCHAAGGRGTIQRAPNLTDMEWLHSMGDFEGILQTITWGVPRERMKAMTPRPFQMLPGGGAALNFPQRRALAAYVWSLGNGRQPREVQSQNEVLAMLEEGSVDEAMAFFREHRTDSDTTLLFVEGGLNTLGYEFLLFREEPDIPTAIAIFELNVELYPDAFNTWDSLGEAYVANGETQLAIESYQRSLELNPDNANAVTKLAELGNP